MPRMANIRCLPLVLSGNPLRGNRENKINVILYRSKNFISVRPDRSKPETHAKVSELKGRTPMKKLKTIFDTQCICPFNFGPYRPSDQGERKLDTIFLFCSNCDDRLITLSYHTLIIVCIGTMLLGITAGSLGVFALLRKQSLLGDTISHAAFPGIALMFLATHSRNPLILILGGSIAGCIGTILMLAYHALTKLKQDTVLGIILSVFFGFGLVLMTVIQKYAIPTPIDFK